MEYCAYNGTAARGRGLTLFGGRQFTARSAPPPVRRIFARRRTAFGRVHHCVRTYAKRAGGDTVVGARAPALKNPSAPPRAIAARR